MSDIVFLTAAEMARHIRSGELSAREVMAAHLAQIERVNSQVNAIVTLLPERAMDAARAADEAQANAQPLGPLHGLPIAHKDLALTRGIRTTFGSPIFSDFVPEVNALIIDRIQAAGAITIGKTNTPEFGAGSQTFNPVFGATLNPYDVTKTCGGSSGGAAVSLACGMLPIADGSDMGGSLRNPANFCNVVGFRPSPGRVASWPRFDAWATLSVEGPMARTVEDAALLLSVMAGPDGRSPISLETLGGVFAAPLERDFAGVRVAWSRDLGGLPVDPRVTAAIDAQRSTFESLGCQVEDDAPGFGEADEVFKTMRALAFEMSHGLLLDAHRDRMKDTVVWNIEAGRALTGADVARAERLRTTLYERVRVFLEGYEFLVAPVSQVPPFEVTEPYVREINGVPMATYIDWMQSCYFISILGLPAISVPCGFTPQGLPVGVQIVGRWHDDLGVLQLAHAFQQATGAWRPPALAAPASAG
ncbi:MAG: amidase [Anaerolineae bacterium]